MLGGFLLWAAVYLRYLLTSTPFSVYILDKLDIRTYFLPNIACDNCNNFSYSYIVENKDACSDAAEEIHLLIIVMSYHANVKARNVIRNTWGSIREYQGYKIRVLFAFGTHQDKNLNNQMQFEQERHGDIIQADVSDNYRSLTNKTMWCLRWVTQNCKHAKFVLKTDDDSFNIPQRYVEHLSSLAPSVTDFVGGYCFTVMPDRRESSKFYTAESVYPDSYYPTYCAGPAYVLSISSVRKIVDVASNVKFVSMEDVFVTGMCRVASRQQYVQIVGTVVSIDDMDRCDFATWVKNGHKIVPERTEQLWEVVKDADSIEDCVWRNFGLFLVVIGIILGWIFLVYKILRTAGPICYYNIK